MYLTGIIEISSYLRVYIYPDPNIASIRLFKNVNQPIQLAR